MGGNYGVTWLFTNSSPQHNLVGDACLIRDGLENMSRDVLIYRYEILAADTCLYMRPLSSVVVYRQGQQYIVEDAQFVQDDGFWNRAQIDEDGIWFANNDSVLSMRYACVDGGVAAALQEVG